MQCMMFRRLKRPIRCILPRSDDMVATGARHSCRADYKVHHL